MEQIIQHETYGAIIFEESFWTGRKKLSIGGAIGAMFGFLGLYVMHSVKGIFPKIMIALLMVMIAFAVCVMIAYAILGALIQ